MRRRKEGGGACRDRSRWGWTGGREGEREEEEGERWDGYFQHLYEIVLTAWACNATVDACALASTPGLARHPCLAHRGGEHLEEEEEEEEEEEVLCLVRSASSRRKALPSGRGMCGSDSSGCRTMSGGLFPA
jgi:hypothetical protein